MCVTDRHDMTLTAKVALNLNTTNQPIKTLLENAMFLWQWRLRGLKTMWEKQVGFLKRSQERSASLISNSL